MTLPPLYWLSLIAAIFYGAAFCWRAPSPLRAWVKTMAVGMLVIFAAANEAPFFLIAALAASAVGDAALAGSGERRFMAGLISFAIAHLFYIALLAPAAGALPQAQAMLLIALGLSSFYWLLPYTGKLRIAVLIYVGLITTMGLLALAHPSPAVKWGAIAFVASDVLLSIQLFRMREDSALQVPISLTLWSLYYLGQLGILWGILI